MALDKKALAQEMLKATQNGTKRNAVLDKLAKTIENYVKQNAEFGFQWIGTNPSNGATEVQAPKGKFINVKISFDSFKSSNPDKSTSAFSLMAGDLIKCFSLATYNISDGGYGTAPGIFGSSGAISSLILGVSNKPNRNKAFEDLAGKIVSWIKAQKPSAPCAGSHSSYIGVGIPTMVN